MEISVKTSAGVTELVAPADFGSFSVTISGDAERGRELLAAAGATVDASHAWIPVDMLRSLAGPVVTPEWERGLSAMVDYAGAHGWLAPDTGAIRAHIQDAGQNSEGE